MDKKHHQRRQKGLSHEELSDMAHPAASFSTEAGRAAQGMRRDLGGKTAPKSDSTKASRDNDETLDAEAILSSERSDSKIAKITKMTKKTL